MYLEIDENKIDYTDSNVWDLISAGDTVGVFQLESRVGRRYAQEAQPRSVEELSDLIAIIRPGCLQSRLEDGRSLTDHYIARKMGKEEVEYVHPLLEPILSRTQGILCIHEDTLISLNNGYHKKISEIKQKDGIKSVNLETLKTENDICADICKSRIEPGLILKLENGFKITLTKDHKVYTDRGWIEVQDLDIENDLVATIFNQKNKDNGPAFFNAQLFKNSLVSAYIMGQYVGDGCGGDAIAVGEKDACDKLTSWLMENTHLNIRPYFHTRSYYISLTTKITKKPSPYKKWIRKFGLEKTKENKKMPQSIFNSSKKHQLAFIAGLIDSDGHIGVTGTNQNSLLITFCSGYKHNIYDLRQLLSLLGIGCYIDKLEQHIHIKNKDKFVELIRPYLVIKSFSNLPIPKIDNYGTIKRRDLQKFIKSKYGSVKKYAPTAYASIYGDGFCSQTIGERAGIDYGDVKWQKIKKIEPTIEPQIFYSISVEKNHNLIGNNILIKNCYQEQAIQIGTEIAHMTPAQADTYLRYGIGKKKADLIAKAKDIFIQGCQKSYISKKEAELIFSWIEHSSRYSFNASHAVSYAQHGYLSAYAKYYFPKEFFTVYLKHAKHRGAKKEDEKRVIIQDARRHGHEVHLLDIRKCSKEYAIIDDKIRVGFIDIKYCGDRDWEKWQEWLKTNPVPNTWDEFLVFASENFTSRCMESLIMSGSLDCYKKSRKKLQYQYNLWQRLNDRQVQYIKDNYMGSVSSCLNSIISMGTGKNQPCYNKNSLTKAVAVLKDWNNEAYNTWTSTQEIEQSEIDLIGAPITCSHLEENEFEYIANTTCQDLIEAQIDYKKQYKVLCTINSFKVITTKKDKKEMAFVNFTDGFFDIEDGVIFTEAYAQYKNYLVEGLDVILLIKKTKPNSYIIEKIIEA